VWSSLLVDSPFAGLIDLLRIGLQGGRIAIKN